MLELISYISPVILILCSFCLLSWYMFGDIDMRYIKNRGTSIGKKWRECIDNIGFNIFDALIILINNMFVKQMIVILDFITNVLKGFVGICHYNNNIDTETQTDVGNKDIGDIDNEDIDNEDIGDVNNDDEIDSWDNTGSSDNELSDANESEIIDESVNNVDTYANINDEHIDDDHIDENKDPKTDDVSGEERSIPSDIDEYMDECAHSDGRFDEKHDIKYTKIKIGKRNNKINVVSEQI